MKLVNCNNSNKCQRLIQNLNIYSLRRSVILGQLRAYYYKFRTEITRKCGNNIEYYNIEKVGAGRIESGAV